MVDVHGAADRRAIEFLTLTTGSATIHQRREIHDATMDIAAGLLSGRVYDGWSVQSAETATGQHVFSVSTGGRLLSTCFLCALKESTNALWETVENLAPAHVVLHRPRGTPWLAVNLAPTAILEPRELLLALPWLELALAWRILESNVTQ